MAVLDAAVAKNAGNAVWQAPAKINLCLHVVGRRADGYHELQSLVQFISLYDKLTFATTQDGVIARSGGDDLPTEDLCVRAALALQKATGTKLGANISLQKNIPMGAGLGGGSSDAATTLIALNKLWKTGLSRNELAGIGLTLGADLPLFIHGQNTLVEGIGERLTPISLPETTFYLFVPQILVSTPQIYADGQLTRDTPVKTIRGLLDGYAANRSGQSPNSEFRNDLQPVTCRLYSEVSGIIERLKPFGHPRMSGSGGAVFIQANHPERDQLALSECGLGNVDSFCVSGLTRHPHYDV